MSIDFALRKEPHRLGSKMRDPVAVLVGGQAHGCRNVGDEDDEAGSEIGDDDDLPFLSRLARTRSLSLLRPVFVAALLLFRQGGRRRDGGESSTIEEQRISVRDLKLLVSKGVESRV